jgi:hypothetical protein
VQVALGVFVPTQRVGQVDSMHGGSYRADRIAASRMTPV